MRVLIAEDHAPSRKLLKHLIKPLQSYEMVGEAVNGEDLICKVMIEKPDIILVDINMPLLNGMEAVKSCKKVVPSLQVIFITGHDEFALEAFSVNAIDYIVKPIDRDRLYAALGRAAALAKTPAESERPTVKKDLMVKQSNRFSFIPLDDIIFIERADRKAVIHTIDQKIEVNEALTNLEELLDSRFVASHRSYIINLQYLKRIETAGQTYKAYFKNYEETAKVSKNKLAELQKNKSL
ncbi:LytTR family two component transcriptional regulator [Neobacillus bataviensis]|uniref:LytTR family two component transcriptional regulator n=1 Tax=Neobacillus bataviensis TaxID=220685 RepID=A0A561DP50_9BACI|nr:MULTISPECIES: LytTR family DNA-binding domain-containing protein [Neobacillus]MCM3726568.1 LytTR family DNA-binding domain-containing protein [Neobacillus cucumis]TWE05108.1 LytTR family two component transcriptional regulator [Neobacillus bataviensis]